MAVVQLWLEAEHGQGLSAPMRVEATPEASGGQYVWVPERTGNLTDASAPGGEALYQFTAPVTGTYVVWGQVSAPSTASDSFFVAMDEAPYFVWGLPRDVSGAWQWAALSEAGSKQAVRFELAAGEHTLRVKQREDGAKLDRLVITNEMEFIPPAATAAAVVQLWLEAEHGQGLSAPMRVEATPEASGGQYVWVPERTGNLTDASAPGGEALYQFTAPVTGTYVVWGQVSAPSTASDSFFVAMDEAPYFVWGLPRDASGAWQWAALSEAGSKQAVRFELAAGEHTLRVKQREDGAKLDRLVLTNDVDFIP
jgi:hypothetical protein